MIFFYYLFILQNLHLTSTWTQHSRGFSLTWERRSRVRADYKYTQTADWRERIFIYFSFSATGEGEKQPLCPCCRVLLLLASAKNRGWCWESEVCSGWTRWWRHGERTREHFFSLYMIILQHLLKCTFHLMFIKSSCVFLVEKTKKGKVHVLDLPAGGNRRYTVTGYRK